MTMNSPLHLLHYLTTTRPRGRSTTTKESIMSKQKFTALALAAMLLAGCGGGGDNLRDERDALQAELEDTQKDLEEVKAAAKQAAAEAEEAKKAEAAAKSQADAAAQQRQDEAARRTAAEQEQKRLETEAEKATQRVNTAEAKQVLAGLDDAIASASVTVVGKHGATATVTTIPATGSSASGSSMGRWFKTSRTRQDATNVDRLEVYTDVEALKSILFQASTYNADGSVVDNEGKVTGSVEISADRPDTAAGVFPGVSAAPTPFNYLDRGYDDQAAKDAALAECGADETACRNAANRIPVRNTDRHPDRYSYETGGTLGGASGTFRCSAADTDTACTVQNRGNTFAFAGPWKFIPNANAKVRVEDGEWMRFGWWARQQRSNDAWTFHTFHGGTTPTDTSDVTGTATYTGPASGYYAMSLPGTAQSRHGRFDASATLRANFANDKLSGSVTNFQQEPDWSLTLKEADIADSGAASNPTDGVSWTVGDETTDGGEWAAQFYSNVPLATSGIAGGIRPAGVAGTFEAEFGDVVVGRMVGAFGAHYTGP